MSRMFDAIENARALAPVSGGRGLSVPILPGSTDLPLLQLWQAIEVKLAGRPRRVVQITACAEGEHDSAVAVRLARLAARTLSGGVLLLNPVESETRLDDDGALTWGPLPGRSGDARALNPHLLDEYWNCLAERADLIVLDTPPVLSSSLSQALAPTADGVVLVVESERTRAAIAQAAKRALEAGGANILGVVLNRRRHHVPKPLYDRL